jgi:hypothetical protein
MDSLLGSTVDSPRDLHMSTAVKEKEKRTKRPFFQHLLSPSKLLEQGLSLILILQENALATGKLRLQTTCACCRW